MSPSKEGENIYNLLIFHLGVMVNNPFKVKTPLITNVVVPSLVALDTL